MSFMLETGPFTLMKMMNYRTTHFVFSVHFVKNYTASTLERHLVSLDTGRTPITDPERELTTSTFHQVVMTEEVDVLVLYYTPWCGYCATFAHIYLSLAFYFQNAKNIIFTRSVYTILLVTQLMYVIYIPLRYDQF